MKRLFTLLWLCTLAYVVQSQSLVKMRYFFDEAMLFPQEIELTPVNLLEETFEINISGLSQGVHTVYIELQNSDGTWSHYDRIQFQITAGASMFSLNSAEYFFDADPGFGNGIQLNVSGATLNESIPLSVSGLSAGIHRVFFRVKDAAGQWSHYWSQLIQVTAGGYETLVQMEYFFDEDPGFGFGQPIALANTEEISSEVEITVPSDLSLGIHYLYVRFQDTSGQWSHYAFDTLVVCDIPIPEITSNGEELTTIIGDYTYQWTLNGEEVENNTTSSFIPPGEGVVQVTITDSDCSATSLPFTYVGIEKIPSQSFYLFPNPAHTTINVTTPKTGVMEVYDTSGRMIIRETIYPGTRELSLQPLAAQTYIVRVYFDDGSSIQDLLLVQ